jgi:hypothetical protein
MKDTKTKPTREEFERMTPREQVFAMMREGAESQTISRRPLPIKFRIAIFLSNKLRKLLQSKMGRKIFLFFLFWKKPVTKD